MPLSDQSIDVLEKAGVLRDKSGLVFPSPRNNGKPLNNATMMLFLQRAGLADRATVHGLRSFRPGMSELRRMVADEEWEIWHVFRLLKLSHLWLLPKHQ